MYAVSRRLEAAQSMKVESGQAHLSAVAATSRRERRMRTRACILASMRDLPVAHSPASSLLWKLLIMADCNQSGYSVNEFHRPDEGLITCGFDAAGEQTLAHADALGRTGGRETYHRPGTGPDPPHVLYSTSESEYDGLGRVLAVYQNRHLVNAPMKTMRYDTMGRKIEQQAANFGGILPT